MWNNQHSFNVLLRFTEIPSTSCNKIIQRSIHGNPLGAIKTYSFNDFTASTYKSTQSCHYHYCLLIAQHLQPKLTTTSELNIQDFFDRHSSWVRTRQRIWILDIQHPKQLWLLQGQRSVAPNHGQARCMKSLVLHSDMPKPLDHICVAMGCSNFIPFTILHRPHQR